MLSLKSVVCALVCSLAVTIAQVGETGPNNETAPTFIENEIVVHTVTVGYFTDAFQPNSINVNPGDKVMFKFYPGGHSVIQSLYGWPCIPRSSVTGEQGFYSGAFPDATDDEPLVWNLTVTNTNPIFYYCGAPGSCINYGMLGVINPTNATNLTGQIDLAKQSRYSLEPNQTLPASAASSISALAATILASPTNEPDSNGHHSALSAGAIAGIAVGGAAALALLGGLIFYLGRRGGQKRSRRDSVYPHSSGVVSPAPPPHAPPQMVVDGVAYVPAYDPRASVQKSSFLPPYQYPVQDNRSRSPETISSHATTMQYPVQSPNGHSSSRFSETMDTSFFAPVPRHELYGQPVLHESEAEGGEGRPTIQ